MKQALMLVAAATLSLPALGEETPPLDFDPVSFTIIGTSAGSPPWLIQQSFWEPMAEKSEGKLDVTITSATELGLKGPETWRMAKNGVAQITMSAMGFSSGDIPENDGMDLPGLALDLDTLRQAINVYQPTLENLYADRAGVEILGLFPLAAQIVWCNGPIAGLDDLRNKKVRVSGAAPAEFIEAVGGIPTTIAFAEVVPALQRNVVDCAVTGTVAGNVAKWTEVTTHIYPIVIGWGVSAVYANKAWWDSLEPQARAYIDFQVGEMVNLAWEQARVGTDQGIWCTTGDARCEPDVVVPVALDIKELTLAPVTEADREKRIELIETWTLPKFAERCGQACIDEWNKTVGPIFGIEAKMP